MNFRLSFLSFPLQERRRWMDGWMDEDLSQPDPVLFCSVLFCSALFGTTGTWNALHTIQYIKRQSPTKPNQHISIETTHSLTHSLTHRNSPLIT